jgi:hypothetical protein
MLQTLALFPDVLHFLLLILKKAIKNLQMSTRVFVLVFFFEKKC